MRGVSGDIEWRMAPLLAAALTVVALGSCAVPGASPVSPVVFDTMTAWIHHDGDSTRLLVEIASSESQQEVGLSGRSFLSPESGMVFQFESLRSREDGFWMGRTEIPLDIAFIDSAGVIRRILGMDACASEVGPDSCPGYFPDVEYVSALETNRGWFAGKGIGVGARVTLGRRPRDLPLAAIESGPRATSSFNGGPTGLERRD